MRSPAAKVYDEYDKNFSALMAMPARLIRSAGGTPLFRSWIVYATAGMYLPAYDSPVA